MARLPYPGSRFSPMRLVPLSDPFDDPDWVWEPKFDGFRALAFVRSGVCRFESRDSNTLTRFPDLARAVATSIRGHEAVLDGEIVCLDEQGRSDFRALLTRTGQTVYCAFDMLEIDGRDLRDAPLDGRKGELSTLVPSSQSRTLLVEHMGETGRALFEAACAHDSRGRRRQVAPRAVRGRPAHLVVGRRGQPGLLAPPSSRNGRRSPQTGAAGARVMPGSRLTFGAVRVRNLPVRGASAVAAIPGALLVVEDDRGIYRVERGRARLWAGRDLHPALGDLEGLTVNEARTHVWALAEEDGAVISMRLRDHLPRPVAIGHLPRPGRTKNKGFEGLAFMPARLSPSHRTSLVAVHEGKPRRVGIFALPDLELTHDLKLPGPIKDLLPDLADVTVDPVSGELLLLSDQSRRVVVVQVAGETLALSDSYDLPLGKKEKPEGLDFASPSRLLIVTDDSARLLEIEVRRRGRVNSPSDPESSGRSDEVRRDDSRTARRSR